MVKLNFSFRRETRIAEMFLLQYVLEIELFTIADQKKFSDADVNILDPDTNTRVKVLQNECNIAHKTSRDYKTKTGEDTRQLEELIQKSST